MTPDSPGVMAAEGAAYVVPTGSNVAAMRTVVPVMAGLAVRLAAGEPVGGPDEEGYLPRGLRSNTTSDRTGARARHRPAVGQARRRRPHRGGTHRRTGGARPAGRRRVVRPAGARLRSGVRAAGQPRSLPTRHANVWLRYPIVGVDSLAAGAYESVHAGFDTTRATPTRTGSCRWTRLASWSAEGRSGRCTMRSTRRPASTRRWPPPPSSGRRSLPSCWRRRSERSILTGT